MAGLELHDLGARAVLVDAGGHVTAREERAATGEDLAAAAIAALDHLAASSTPLTSLGICSDTPYRPSHSRVLDAMSKRYPGRLLVDGIVAAGTAAAVSEAWIGAARGASTLVYFAAGDRTTAGVLLRGQPWRGAHGRAADAAWLALNPVERDDYRKHGCLEAEAAAFGIVRRLVWRVKAGDRSRAQDAAGGDLNAITLDMILDAARAGDGVSISVMRDTAKYLGMAAANLVAIVDPEVLVLGGIIATAADLLFESVRSEIARRLPPADVGSIQVLPAALGRDAAVIGAARLAMAAAP
jgi:hypothetical protein